jgi:septal ring-binding cell division protein DamX
LHFAVAATLVVGLALGVLLNQWRAKNPARQNLAVAAKLEEKVTEKTASPPVTTAVAETKRAEPAVSALQPGTQKQSNQAAAAAIPAPAPTVAPTPIETNDILERRLQATKNWLNQQPTSTVSIQLMGNSNDDQLRMGLETLGTQVELDNVYVFRTRVSNRPFVTVLYGSYPSREEAIQAMQKLPRALRVNRPQLRTIGGILEETKQLQ